MFTFTVHSYLWRHQHCALFTYKDPLVRHLEKSRPSLQPKAGHLLPALLRPSDLKAHLLFGSSP